MSLPPIIALEVSNTVRLSVCACESVFRHFISRMNGDTSMKLITINHRQAGLRDTDNTEKVSTQWVKGQDQTAMDIML